MVTFIASEQCYLRCSFADHCWCTLSPTRNVVSTEAAREYLEVFEQFDVVCNTILYKSFILTTRKNNLVLQHSWVKKTLLNTMNTLKFTYPFHSWWTLGLFLVWGYFKECCYEHGFYTCHWVCWVMGHIHMSSLRRYWLPLFQSVYTNYTPTSCSMAVQTLGIVSLFNFSYSCGCAVVSWIYYAFLLWLIKLNTFSYVYRLFR